MTIGATTQSLAAWGISEASISFDAHGIDRLMLVAGGRSITDTDLMAWGDSVTLYKGETKWFVGTCTSLPVAGDDTKEAQVYEVSGPGWDLAELMFQQTWTVMVGGTPTTASTSHLILNLGFDGSTPILVSVAEQIEEVIDYAIARGRSITKGNILTGYSLFPPLDEVRELMCGEVIAKQLRWIPDAVQWFDYTTTTPTYHCRKKADLSATSLAIGSTEHVVSGIAITPRTDLQRPAVYIRYEVKSTVDGQEYLSYVTDKWPADCTGLEFRAVNLSIDLSGGTSASTSAVITVDAIDANHATTATKVNWWKAHIPFLASTTVDSASIVVENVTFADGNYSNELTKGQWVSWMGGHATKEKVTAEISFDTKNAAADVVHKVSKKQVSVELISTDLDTGTDVVYSHVTAYEDADPRPAYEGEGGATGLAHYLYNNLNVLQYDGTFTLHEEEVSGTVRPGKVVNITGGRTAWASMAALVQKTVEHIHSGVTEVTVGPANQLGPQDIIELLKVTRPRRRWTSASVVGGSSLAANGSVELGKYTSSKDNSSGAGDTQRLFVKKDSNNSILLDPDDTDKCVIKRGGVIIKPRLTCVQGDGGVEEQVYVMRAPVTGETP